MGMSWTSGSLMGASTVDRIRRAGGLQPREVDPPKGPDDLQKVLGREGELAVRGELTRIVSVGIDVVAFELVAADMGQLGESMDQVAAEGADELASGAGTRGHHGC